MSKQAVQLKVLSTPLSLCLPLQGMPSNLFGHHSRPAAQACLRCLPMWEVLASAGIQGSPNLYLANSSTLRSFFAYLPLQGLEGGVSRASLSQQALALQQSYMQPSHSCRVACPQLPQRHMSSSRQAASTRPDTSTPWMSSPRLALLVEGQCEPALGQPRRSRGTLPCLPPRSSPTSCASAEWRWGRRMIS